MKTISSRTSQQKSHAATTRPFFSKTADRDTETSPFFTPASSIAAPNLQRGSAEAEPKEQEEILKTAEAGSIQRADTGLLLPPQEDASEPVIQRKPNEGTTIGEEQALVQTELIQREPEEEKQAQTFGRPPPGVGDYVPDRPTVPIAKPEHKLMKQGTREFTYDEWLASNLGRPLTAEERASFERGCVGLMLLRLGYPDKQWPWEIPGNECWLTESKALQRQKEMKARCNGFPPAMYAFQSDGGWKPGHEPNQKQINGEEPVDPNNVKMTFMPDPDYNLWNFSTRFNNVWEWMNHAKTFSTPAEPWRVRVRTDLPSDLGSGKSVITLFGLVCPKAPANLPGAKQPGPQPKPPQQSS